MANHKSALKKARQDIVRRARNRSGRSALRSELKKFRTGIASGEDMTSQLNQMASLIDRSAKRGLIHSNAAARLKSRLTRQVQSSN